MTVQVDCNLFSQVRGSLAWVYWKTIRILSPSDFNMHDLRFRTCQRRTCFYVRYYERHIIVISLKYCGSDKIGLAYYLCVVYYLNTIKRKLVAKIILLEVRRYMYSLKQNKRSFTVFLSLINIY